MNKRTSPERQSSGGFSSIGRRVLLVCMGVSLLLLSVAVISYPIISNAGYERMCERGEAEYLQAVEHTESTALKNELSLARAYNAALAEGDPLPADYDDVLNLSGTGLMGYVEIPKLNLKLPVCHGTDAGTLGAAVGHLSGTALPVGGEGTHCILTGHSGLASKRLFTDLDEMETGDVFYLEVLGERLCYKVDDISVILPYELDAVAAVPGKDLCTLVTCTPFGVNTHRLLVRGARIEETVDDEHAPEEGGDETVEPKKDVETRASSAWMKKYITVMLLCLSAAGVIAAGVFAIRNARNKRKEREKNNENL